MRKFLLFVSFIVLSVSVYAQVPTITSFSPASGAVGSSVTITGTGFNATASNNLVFFDGVKANLSQSSTTQLIAVVPAGTTGNSKIKVINLQTGLVISKFEFTTIFHNANFGNSSYASGAFLAPITYSGSSRWETTADNTSIVGCADFNLDGYPDYVSVSNVSPTIKIHKNNLTQPSQSLNTSSFSSTPIDLTGSANSISVYTEDVNADGKIDVVSLNSSSVNIFINTSSGSNLSFSSNQNIVMTGGTRLRFVDLNQDGLLDIVRHNGTTLSYRLNTSVLGSNTISFGTATNITVPHSMIDFAFVDINNDNILDILSISSGNYSISIGSGSGFGSFNSIAGVFRNGIQTGDFDADGDIDFATKVGAWSNDNPSPRVVCYINNGSGQFTTASAVLSNPSGIFNGFEKANFNGDDFPDFASSNSNSGGIISIFNNTTSNSGLSFAASTGVSVTSNPMGFVACDVNLDGRPDVISPGYYNSNFYVLENIIGLPRLSSFTPSSGSVGSTVTISGVNFTGTTAVSFNNIPATSFTVVNNTTINAVVPSSTTGSIQITTPGGTVTSGSNFTFAPGISVSGTLSSFSKCGNTPSTAQQVTVSGSNLTGNISVAALTGYEYSTDGSTYASTLSLSQSSGSVSSTVYVRLTAGSSGSPAGNIVFSSNGATSVNLAATGTANSVRPFNQALNFDGSNDKVSIPSNSLHQLSSGFTIEAWVKVDQSVSVGGSTYMGIATKVIWSGSGLGYGLDIDGGKARIFSGQGWSNWSGVSAPNNITKNVWVHLAGTYNGSIFRLYVDGQEVASNSSSTGISTNTQSFTIGSWPNENKYFKGDLDEVRIWNVVRTASQISQSKDVELNGNETGLVSYFNFNQGTPSGNNPTVTSLSDATSNGLNGSLNSFGLTGATSNWIAGGPMILNDPSMCINGSATLSHTNTGGTWSTSDANIISIDQSTGIATAVAVGSATITYAFSVNGCPFTSTKVFTVSQTPDAPSATANVNYCRNASATALTATAASGNTLQWYTAATGGSPISAPTPTTTTLGSTLYYVSQKTNAAGCEGPRTTITVSINPNTSITTQPVSPTAVCLNANSNTISVTAAGGNLTYQWFTNTINSTTGATSISSATNDSHQVPTNIAGTRFYYVVVSGTCGSSVTSNLVSQVVNSSTFTTQPSDATQNLAFGGTATALTVASPGATAYQWYSTPTKPSLLDGFTGTTGFTSSTGAFQSLSGNSGQHPAINAGVLTFAYIDGSSVYRDFNLDQTATTVSFSTEYAETDRDNNKAGDVGKIQLQFLNASNTQVGTIVESPQFTGTLTFQSVSLSNVSIPSGATKVRVIFFQVTEAEFWAGNYGIAFRNPSVTTDVALNGTLLTGATSATYTPSTSTPGALYFYAVATGGCSTATSALSGLITVGKATPTIASMAAINKIFGDAAFTLTVPTSNATGAFTFASSNTAVATISGTTVTIVGAGTATITATQATDANYNAGSVTALLTVAKATPTIGSMSAISKTVGDAAFALSAPSSNSTGAITYTSSNTSVATVSGSTVTIVGAGTATITATQATSNNYNAGSVTTTLTVAKAARTLSSFADINKTTTDAPFTLIAPVSSAGTGAFTYSSSNTAVATVSGSTVTIVGIGTATITATQAADANYLGATISATLTVVLGDSDGDGVPDDVEIRDGTDPNNPSSVKDSDGDGVPDYVEIGSGTNPNSPADAIDSDGDGLSDYYEARNAAPTNIILSATTVNENNTAGNAIVDLAATDVNIGEVFTYTLVSGTGDADNASFTINGSSLRAVNAFDFETRTTYSLRLKVTDKGGLSFEKEFTITVADVNEAPTALALSNTSVLENAASGTTVGTLAGTDADAGDSHTYSLVTGTGSTDNASFTITGTTLSTAAVFNFEAKNSYAVRVRVTDAGGLSFERAFTISVTDVNEAPTLTAITDRRVYNVSTSQVVNLAGITAGPETAQSTTTSVSTDRPATFSSISVVGTQIQFTLAAGIVTPQDVVVTVRVRDNGGVANGGVDSVVRTFRLGIDPMPVAAASPTLITLGATAQLSATGANAVNYTWVAVGGSGIVGSGANINVRPRGTTTYAVVVTNSFGYQATVPVLLTVIVDYKLVPNNLVTPNGDGVNDRWVIPNIDMYPENEVMVYDKAGRAVFAKRGYNNEWDGTVNGKLLKEDAYFYVIKFNKDGALPIRGYVSIVR